MYAKSIRSVVLVVVQFVLIFAIAAYAGVHGSVLQNAFTAIAVALGVWAILVMNFRVNVFPDVRKKQQLYVGGPYHLIRHPMYTAVLLATAAWAAHRLDVLSVAMWLVLLIDLLVKLHYEEHMLRATFPEYAAYMRRTKRLVPFVY